MSPGADGPRGAASVPAPDGDRVRTVFLGSGPFGLDTLRRLDRHPAAQLVGVVTAPARPSGRGHRLSQTVIATAAGELGIEAILTPERLRAQDAVAAVIALDPALLVLADYGQIVPPALLGLPHGALNLHPSLLPRHRGATPVPAAILAGDPVTGVTLMRMDAGLDTGPIVAQATVDLDGTETAPALEARLAALGASLLDDELGPWLRGERVASPQPAGGATLTRPLRRDDGRLDPGRSAAELERQVRALVPWPGTFLETDGERLVVTAASIAPDAPGDVPGRLVRHAGRPALTTAAGRLVLEVVTPPGRRSMSGEDYLRGRRPPLD